MWFLRKSIQIKMPCFQTDECCKVAKTWIKCFAKKKCGHLIPKSCIHWKVFKLYKLWFSVFHVEFLYIFCKVVSVYGYLYFSLHSWKVKNLQRFLCHSNTMILWSLSIQTKKREVGDFYGCSYLVILSFLYTILIILLVWIMYKKNNIILVLIHKSSLNV